MPQITIVLGGPMGMGHGDMDDMGKESPEAEGKEKSEAGEYGFDEKVKLPFAALSPKERIRREFGEGMALSDEQKAALECFEALPSTTQNMLLRKASEAGQSFVDGGSLLEAKAMFEGDEEKREGEFADLNGGELDDTTGSTIEDEDESEYE